MSAGARFLVPKSDPDLTHGLVRNHQKGMCLYSAQLAVGSLWLLTKATQLSAALEFLAVLRMVRQRFLETPADSFEDRFRTAVEGTFAQRDVHDAHAMGFRFKVVLRPLWVKAPLCTRAYRTSEMEKGLEAYRRLCVHRHHVGANRVLRERAPPELAREWCNLRATFREVMVSAGGCPMKVEARLDAVQAERNTEMERQLEAWNRSCMTREDRSSQGSGGSLTGQLDRFLKRWARLPAELPSMKRHCTSTF